MVDGANGISDATALILRASEAASLKRSGSVLISEDPSYFNDLAMRYRELFERNTDGIAICGTRDDGNEFFLAGLNPACAHIIALKREDAIGRDVREILPGMVVSGLLESFRWVWRTGQPQEIPAFRYDDGRLRFWFRNSVFKLPFGEIAAVFRDVTDIKMAEEEIRGFSRRLLSTREDEKRRISTALHHDTGSLAIGVKGRLVAAEDDLRAGRVRQAIESLHELRRVFDQALASLKDLAIRLRPPDLDLLGLTAALRYHFETVTRGTALRVHFTDGTHGAVIDRETAMVLFRIAQEALTNAASHGAAKVVKVRLYASKPGLRMTVRDDGCGFAREAVVERRSETLGLISMHEMAKSLGGQVDIESTPGHGTLVRVWIPRQGFPLPGSIKQC
jgi:signal transduction histidine kinase